MSKYVTSFEILPPALLRGRKAVRADRRLCTDEKAIRAQSTISYENARPSVPLSVTGVSVRMLFIRTETPVGARSAQGRGRLTDRRFHSRKNIC
ncbi:MAG: hypothetical protein AAB325_12520 [Pseudomonadota bacterium]